MASKASKKRKEKDWIRLQQWLLLLGFLFGPALFVGGIIAMATGGFSSGAPPLAVGFFISLAWIYGVRMCCLHECQLDICGCCFGDKKDDAGEQLEARKTERAEKNREKKARKKARKKALQAGSDAQAVQATVVTIDSAGPGAMAQPVGVEMVQPTYPNPNYPDPYPAGATLAPAPPVPPMLAPGSDHDGASAV